jgi:ribose/xylose/arabinose/galactoside ABC-type transport system permease subunit
MNEAESAAVRATGLAGPPPARRLADWRRALPFLTFALFLVIGATFTDAFFTERNVTNLLRQIVANGLISLGMLIVILTGGIDLSVGPVVALGGVLFAGLSDRIGLAPALAVGVLAGGAAGLANGLVIARFRLQPFIVTLATMGIFRGLVFLYTESPISPAHPAFRVLGVPVLGPFSIGLGITLACYVLAGFFLNRTAPGRAIVAVGGNAEAVRLAGISVPRTIATAYALSGVLSALAGGILVSRLGIAQPSLGIAYELDAIAACVIGGAVLGGGGGTTLGTLFGVFTLGIINNLMNLLGVRSFYQDIVKGSVIILAVLLVGRGRRP